MEYLDYYKILGITKSASTEEVKKAYRKLARQYHPDINPNNADANKKFQQINEANKELSDPEKRKKYDKYGKDWEHGEAYEQQQRQQSRNYGGGFSGDFEGSDFSDFFASMFGGGSRQRSKSKMRGQDVNASLQVNLSDAFKTHPQTFSIKGKNVRITIPAGIANGQVIKLNGYGNPGINGGASGDLYISFEIINNTPFNRVGNDLQYTQEIDLYTAVLGGDITLDTLHGKLKLKVKPETQNGTKTRVKGKGFPFYKSDTQYGDLYITYSVKLPVNLTDKQKELFIQLSKLS